MIVIHPCVQLSQSPDTFPGFGSSSPDCKSPSILSQYTNPISKQLHTSPPSKHCQPLICFFSLSTPFLHIHCYQHRNLRNNTRTLQQCLTDKTTEDQVCPQITCVSEEASALTDVSQQETHICFIMTLIMWMHSGSLQRQTLMLQSHLFFQLPGNNEERRPGRVTV